MTTVTDTRRLIAGPAELRQAKVVVDQASGTHPDQWVAPQVGDSGIVLPPELSSMLTSIIEMIARGGTVTVGGMPEDITTTVAADLLGISRPTLMKLVAAGDLSAHKAGSHTRFKAADVVAFRRARLERQRKAFEDLLELEDDA